MQKMGIHEKSNIFYALEYATSEWARGFGVSKRETYKKNGGTSPFTHSNSTFNRYAGVAKQLCGYLKEQGVNRIDRITYEKIQSFIDKKIEKELSQSTIKVNLSAIEKFCDTINRKDISDKLRDKYSDFYSKAKPSGRAIAFANPERLIEKIYAKSETHGIVAELQYLTGARIGDVKKIEVDRERQVVNINGSKGGRDRSIDFSDRQEKLERIANLKEKLNSAIRETGWKEIRESYYNSVKSACVSCQELYSGAHAFRVNYAVERHNEL
ncbi:MAG: site-specific integrase, partial [Candidatus Bathyarchaeota archaeon]|nr:site-specific integrase [Candidatus Bathyarchaeota archaeon]